MTSLNWREQDRREQERIDQSPRIIAFPGATQEELQELTDAVTANPSHIIGPTDKIELVPVELPVKDLNEPDMREVIERFYNEGHMTIRGMTERLREKGYAADTLLLGYDPGAEVATTEDLEAGDLVVMDGDGNARRALEGEQVIGVALGDGRIQFTGVAAGNFASGVVAPIHMSMAYGYGSMAYTASIMTAPGQGFPRPQFPRPARYQYNERFPKEVIDKAMALLARFMSAGQYKAFMEGSMIELQNKAEDHRVMLNRQGKFSILTGPRGEGIMMTSGNIGSFAYPIGDEIAVFLDWFRFRTRELIERWNCGTFSIKDYL